jgi:hypothetical protein
MRRNPQEAKRSDDCCLVDISFLYRYLVIALAEVQLTEDGAAMKSRRQVLDVGQRVGIRCSD